MADITGTPGADTLFGTDIDDIIRGFAGADKLYGFAGNDNLDGGEGNDLLDGGTGSDTASYAGASAGVVVDLANLAQQDTFGAGRDTLLSIENLIGSAFADKFVGTAGDNVIDGGAGIDEVIYNAATAGIVVDLGLTTAQNTVGAGLDTLIAIENIIATAFDDTIAGNAGNNRLAGGDGIDTLSYAGATAGVNIVLEVTSQQDSFGAGRDTVFGFENLVGSSFNDKLGGDGGNNRLDGGAGIDLVSYAAATTGVSVSLALNGTQNTRGGGLDTLSNFENLTGSGFDDVLSGDGSDNVIAGGGGNDTVSYAAATSSVTVSLATASAQNTGGGGNDTLSNFENLTGSDFDDMLGGDGGDNVIAGGGGSDTVSYAAATSGVTVSLASMAQQDTLGAGRDTLFSVERLIGSAFNDRITSSNDANVFDGGAGIDLISYAAATRGVSVSLANLGAQETIGSGIETLSNFENLTGSGFDDVLGGDGGDNVIAGGAGNDTVSYAAATSGVIVNLTSAAQQDTFGAGRDTLFSIEGLIGSAFNDRITGSNDANILDGGAGVDLISYAAATTGVVVNLAVASAQDTGGGGIDTLSNFENLTGTGFDDVLGGDGGDNVIAGGLGNDTVSYAAAAAGVTVKLELTTAQDTIGAGHDTLFSIENITGSAFDDRLFGSAGDNIIDGAAGADTVSYAFANTGVTVDLGLSIAQATGAGSDRLANLENLAGSAFDDRLAGDLGDNIITGGAGNDTVIYTRATKGVTVDLGLAFIQDTAGAGRDTLFGFENIVGSAFADRLTGSAGDNIIDGAAGLDFASYVTAASGVVVSLNIAGAQNTIGAGIDTLIGIENLTGSAFDDVLAGSVDNNVINGGPGRDTVSYAASALGVVVNLSLTIGQNTVGAGKDTLSGIENLIGTAFRDKLLGSTGDNVLRGGLGNDLLDGKIGRDTASYVDATAGVTVDLRIIGEQNTGAAGLDTLLSIENLLGSAFADTLVGDDGDNLFIGGAGDDVLRGGGGINTASYAAALGSVEIDLTLVGAQVGGLGAGSDVLSDIHNLIGSAFDDRLTGTASANFFEGGAGDDVLIGGAGIDTASYAEATAGVTVSLALATAQITGGAGSDTLSGFERLIGSAFNDVLTGDDGDNVLTGGLGDDVLTGGLGNDTVSYADAGAAVSVHLNLSVAQETRGGGIDTLSGIENVTGSAFKDVLTGNASANILSGGAGADRLIGGAGADTFVFDTPALAIDKDVIADFRPVDDTIALSNAVFTAFALGPVAANAFVSGAQATTADHHLIYNASNGALFYDVDGVGGIAQIQFAQLTARLAVTAADFVIIG